MGIQRPTPAFGIPNPYNTGLSMHNPQRMGTFPQSTSPRMPLPMGQAPISPPMPIGQTSNAIRPMIPTQAPEKSEKSPLPYPGDNETQTCKFCNDGVHYSKAPFIGMFTNMIDLIKYSKLL